PQVPVQPHRDHRADRPHTPPRNTTLKGPTPMTEHNPKPPRFEDVRTGDEIMVEHKGKDGFWYTAGGAVVVDDLGITIGADGIEFLFTKDARKGWVDGVGDKVVLLAHTPAGTTDPDPMPLHFEDVRTDDLITVQVQDTTVTGPVNASIDDTGRSYSITVKHADLCLKPNHDVGVWFVTGTGRKATLIAHTPAEPEPEWHRAKVIKADTPDAPGRFLRRCSETLASDWRELHPHFFRDGSTAWSPGKLHNVTIIIDEHGQMRA